MAVAEGRALAWVESSLDLGPSLSLSMNERVTCVEVLVVPSTLRVSASSLRPTSQCAGIWRKLYQVRFKKKGGSTATAPSGTGSYR